jgi:hypothetical protein
MTFPERKYPKIQNVTKPALAQYSLSSFFFPFLSSNPSKHFTISCLEVLSPEGIISPALQLFALVGTFIRHHCRPEMSQKYLKQWILAAWDDSCCDHNLLKYDELCSSMFCMLRGVEILPVIHGLCEFRCLLNSLYPSISDARQDQMAIVARTFSFWDTAMNVLNGLSHNLHDSWLHNGHHTKQNQHSHNFLPGDPDMLLCKMAFHMLSTWTWNPSNFGGCQMISGF